MQKAGGAEHISEDFRTFPNARNRVSVDGYEKILNSSIDRRRLDILGNDPRMSEHAGFSSKSDGKYG